MSAVAIHRLVSPLRRGLALPLLLVLALAACAERGAEAPEPRELGDYKVGRPYQVQGVWYYPKVNYDYVETGIASWYGPGFNGRQTANGEIYDQMSLTAAHRTLPMPSMVRVTNLENGRSLALRINDRGPFKNGRIIDVSYQAAKLLDFVKQGTAKVRVEILDQESRQLAAVAQSRRPLGKAPDAAPTVSVEAVPLDPVKAASGNGALAAKAADSAQPQRVALSAGPEARRRGPPRPARRHPPRDADGLTAELEYAAAPIPGASGRKLPAGIEGAGVARLPAAGKPPPAALTRGAPRERFDSVPWPDGKVTREPVRATNIFIQAGSFLRRDYATRLSLRLGVLGRSKVTQALIGDRLFYRVRLGPVGTVDEADRLLAVLLSKGFSDARVVVD